MANPIPKAPAKAPKVQKSFGTNLAGAKGNNLRFLAILRKDGSINAFVTHYVRDAKGKIMKSTRGASSVHSNFDSAKKWIENGVAKATKEGGWKRRRGGGGGRTKADAFTLDNMPKANA